MRIVQNEMLTFKPKVFAKYKIFPTKLTMVMPDFSKVETG